MNYIYHLIISPKNFILKKYFILASILFFNVFTIQSQNSIQIKKAKSSPVIDGILTKGEWTQFDSAFNFTQLEPLKGLPASERTIAFVTYDSLNFYVAFKCFQKSNVIANVQTRDQLRKSDDAVILVIDTYNDNRSGFAFGINPIGTQTDLKINDDGRINNYNRDLEWESKTKVYDWGWTVEIAIPFGSIKFNPTIDQWGINFGRILPSNNETCWWSPDMTDDFRMSQNGSLKGINPPGITNKFLITPYTTASSFNISTKGSASTKMDIGVDLRYNINSNLNINATINPDFASIEGDKQTIDLSGYEISYPEKRLFFQEGNEMFDTRYKLFYSRRIGDINYGGKFTGKAGGFSINLMNVRSLENKSQNEPASFFSVARVKKDIFKSSSIGFVFADKSSDTTGVRSYGIDWMLNFGQHWKITGQLMGSSPGDFFEHSGGFIRIAHESIKHHVHIRYSDLGHSLKDNINDIGFISDDDRKELDADLNYKFWFENKAVKYLSLKNMNNAYWSQNGSFRSSKFRNSLRLYLKNKMSLDLYHVAENRQVDSEYFINNSNGIKFKNNYLRTTLGYNTDESSFVALKYTDGQNFGRDMQIYQADVTFMLFKKMAINYSLIKMDFTPSENPDLTLRLEKPTVLNIISIDYYFTNNIWLHVFAQSDSYEDQVYFYGKFGWRFKPPFGALYLIYAQNDYFDNENLVKINSNTFFLKLTYPIAF